MPHHKYYTNTTQLITVSTILFTTLGMRFSRKISAALRLTQDIFKVATISTLTAFVIACTKADPDNNGDNTGDENGDDSPEVVIKPDVSIKKIEDMSIREKVGQLFFIRPESLCMNSSSSYQILTDDMRKSYTEYPCGGVILYAQNISYPLQTTILTDDLHRLANYPLLCIDEEGGTVARIANNKNFDVPKYKSMGDIGNSNNSVQAFDAGSKIGEYLYTYGLDVNFAPVADVNSNPKNPVIGTRSFSSDPDVAAEMSSQFLLGMKKHHVEGCLKHFPGHGDTSTDSHYGYAETLKSWEQMQSCEMIPFKKGIESGARLIMTAHIATPNVTGNSIPATMSKLFLQDILRKEFGYEGIIVTDGMEMGAITKQYSAGEAAVGVILAGADIVLGPENYKVAFDAVYNAVIDGTISEQRINESVERILALKKEMYEARKDMFK